MICDILENADTYSTMHHGFAQAFTFLRAAEIANLAVGRYAIDGDRIFAIIAKDHGRQREAAQLEVHQRYIDIQFVLAGVDEMGWRPHAQCQQPVGPYDDDRDIRFFRDQPTLWVPVVPGMFAIFYPEDAHMPLIANGIVHKAIVKVAVGN